MLQQNILKCIDLIQRKITTDSLSNAKAKISDMDHEDLKTYLTPFVSILPVKYGKNIECQFLTDIDFQTLIQLCDNRSKRKWLVKIINTAGQKCKGLFLLGTNTQQTIAEIGPKLKDLLGDMRSSRNNPTELLSSVTKLMSDENFKDVLSSLLQKNTDGKSAFGEILNNSEQLLKDCDVDLDVTIPQINEDDMDNLDHIADNALPSQIFNAKKQRNVNTKKLSDLVKEITDTESVEKELASFIGVDKQNLPVHNT